MTNHFPSSPETKSISDPDISGAFEDFLHSFEAFKDANDERLNQIEKRSADVLTDHKVDRISKALDDQQAALDNLILKARRPNLAATFGGAGLSVNAVEHKAAFDRYIRNGSDADLRQLEAKAMSISSDPDGGYLVPEQVEAEVGKRLAAVSPIRAIADVREVSGSVLKKPFSIAGPAVGWVGETASRPQTDASTLAELSFPTMELYAMPAATPSLLDDAAVNIDEWIAAEVETAFAQQEGTAFVTGDGINKPTGFMSATKVVEDSWTWGKLGSISTGVAGAFAASDPGDHLVDLIYTLKAGYRQNAQFVMNRSTQAAVRKLKDSDGNYLWLPPASVGAKASLMNFAITEAEDMPDMEADAYAIAFGDFKRGYLIVDRLGLRILRDPYSAKPYVLFYTTKRVGGGIQDFDAIKLLQFAA
ncbi:phage major capsid protein, HK97 family [Cohaesibacter sp. ES.047]|uniref:phage major capsid protein n=1 Tax=Cohaesibacter sp. ES.047 TaxID=1798205 RepID=UPI000BB67F23|nr:phage major capsid protein [Cohaesibacter sp. ES.047]SNY92797.1 phage major capsid protein, HK97 family [Cohaesibacter sp. ES.047]